MTHKTQRTFFRLLAIVLLSSTMFTVFVSAESRGNSPNKKMDVIENREFIELLQNQEPAYAQSFFEKLDKHWSPHLIPLVLETINYSSSPHVRSSLLSILQRKTGRDHIHDISTWYQWLWSQPENKSLDFQSVDYGDFKASLYSLIDPKFGMYFRGRGASAKIRLDEIAWGGVAQDGIPPLRQPKMIQASEADYLDGDNIVFGVAINGDVRAYPKRILAWHEMFIDNFGKGDDVQAIAGVYCTLCGTVIIYKTEHAGVAHQLGTSGFLYRSNKLMYDKATQSLWSTVRGEPVLGPLAGQGIALEHLSVVTTTWNEWRRRHPDTLVLSMDTGHRRDYGEGAAYSDYFATDRLMFNTPFQDKRLNNKREVLALRFFAAPGEQLAIDTEYLNKNQLYSDAIGKQKFVVLTDKSGANRVYDPKQIKFVGYDGRDTVADVDGGSWKITEQSLISTNGEILNRLPYHRAFWFGWHAAFPETRLIK